MRKECKHYESRTYATGEAVRRCHLGLAPEAPWRCPADCPRYERRLADVAWQHGTLVAPATPDEPPGVGVGDGVGPVLEEARDIVNAAVSDAMAELEAERRRRSGWRRLFRR